MHVVVERLVQHFDRNFAIERLIARRVDDSETAATNDIADDVPREAKLVCVAAGAVVRHERDRQGL
jgi:hypothetical protein